MPVKYVINILNSLKIPPIELPSIETGREIFKKIFNSGSDFRVIFNGKHFGKVLMSYADYCDFSFFTLNDPYDFVKMMLKSIDDDSLREYMYNYEGIIKKTPLFRKKLADQCIDNYNKFNN